MENIGVAIVTYNRLEKLKNALASYSKQTLLPSFLVVVNNKSTDGTNDFLEQWKKRDEGFKKIVVNTDSNLGGAGGFYFAMSESMKHDFDLLWISDDDAYPENSSLKSVVDYFKKTNRKVGAICGVVIENGKINLEHRSIYPKHSLRYPFGKPADISNYNKEEFEINIFSYVGTAISRKALEKCGLTKKEYFIWCDDAEHSMRINKYFDIVCLSSVRIVHDVDPINSSGLSWKTYYGIRNRFDAIRSNGSRCQLIYYHLSHFKQKLISFFSNRKKYHLIKRAIGDYRHNRFGISDIYKPGVKL